MTNIIFTDGSSRGNPGPGGWGAIIINSDNNQVVELGGREDSTTNNRMELTASINALKSTKLTLENILYTDSSYLINGITKWINAWKKNNWKTKTKENVLNKDLWLELLEEKEKRNVDFKLIRGHVGIHGNERCDEIATAFADKKEVNLFNGPISHYQIKDITNVSQNLVKTDPVKKSQKTKAFSYVSAVGGVVEIHHSWQDCEKRVKGVAGAKYKKALSKEEEEKLIREFS